MKTGIKSGVVICSIWLLFACGSCSSYRFVEENNCLKVSSPEYLKDTYQCAISNLGIPQHGGSLSGVVIYPQVNQMGCRSFIDYPLYSFKTKPLGSHPVLLLVDRGDCYFKLKTWNAQNAGAAGILIADDRLEPLTSYMGGEIGGDYYLENITIPCALISKSTGNSMKEALYMGDFIRVNLEWNTEDYELEENGDDDQIEEQQEAINPVCPFIINPSPFWVFLVRFIWSWSISV